MRYRVPYYYKTFHCIGGACESTCCGGWKIPIDDESMERYLHTPGVFGQRLLQGINLSEHRFELKENHCTFLNQEGLCDIYKELGEDRMCKACRRYPRHMEDYGNLRELSLSISCPEAARVILGDVHAGAWVEQERSSGDKEEKRQEGTAEELARLETARNTMFQILDNPALSFYQKLAMITAFAHDVQVHLNRGEHCVKQISNRYLRKTAAESFSKKLSQYEEQGLDGMIRTAAWMREAEALEPVLEHWRAGQRAICTRLYHKMTPEEYEQKRLEFNKKSEALETEWRNLVRYFLYTYVLGAIYDEDIYSKVKMTIFSFVILREWCLFRYCVTGNVSREDLVAACFRYSREVENSDQNLEWLEDRLWESRLFDLDSILKVLCGFRKKNGGSVGA